MNTKVTISVYGFGIGHEAKSD